MSARQALGALTLVGLSAVAACSAPELGDLPVRCAEGECPDGYECVYGVCARHGFDLPITVEHLDLLEGSDLKLVAEDSSVLVVWQSYSSEHEGIVGIRVTSSGSVSPQMSFVRGFTSDENVGTPLYDVLWLPGRRLLVAMSAAPLPERATSGGSAAALAAARIVVYSVNLPPEGDEASGAQYTQAWPQEVRMDAIGYAAVSRPKLVARDAGLVELGYVRTSRRDEGAGDQRVIAAELAVFPMDESGTLLGAPKFRDVRRGMSAAVGVFSAFSCTGAAWWVLDDLRPSVVRVSDDEQQSHAELRLAGNSGIPVAAGSRWFRYFNPSDRVGDKLPSSSVSGQIVFHDVTLTPAPEASHWDFSDVPIILPPGFTPDFPLPVVRDVPHPAWVNREGKLPVLVTPGADFDAPELVVYVVDPDHKSAREVRRIARLSYAPLRATQATIVDGKLFVAWLEGTDAGSTIRLAVVPEP